jgi:hypothetical protein
MDREMGTAGVSYSHPFSHPAPTQHCGSLLGSKDPSGDWNWKWLDWGKAWFLKLPSRVWKCGRKEGVALGKNSK